MIRALLLLLILGVVITVSTLYATRDRAIPFIASQIASRITGIEGIKIRTVSATPSERTLIFQDVAITPEQSIKTLRISPNLIYISDTHLNVILLQEGANWVATLKGTDYRLPLKTQDSAAAPLSLPTIVLNNVAVTIETPHGVITSVANGQFAHQQWIGNVQAESISLTYADTVINGITTTLTSSPDTGWSAEMQINTLTQGQTPLTNLTGTLTNLTTAPRAVISGTLNTEFDFNAVADIDMAGPTKAAIRILNAKNDVGRINLTTNWRDPVKAVLDISNLSLRTLPTLTGWQGLQADGRLSGRFNMTQRPDKQGWTITSGQLKGGQGGFIAYSPDTYPGFLASTDPRLDAVREILKHLNIDDITVTAAGDLSDDIRLGLAIKGRNPNYSPRPVHLNLNFEGSLWPLAQSLLRPLNLIPNINHEKDTSE